MSNLAPTSDTTLSVADFVKLPPVDLDTMYNEIISMLTAAGSSSDVENGEQAENEEVGTVNSSDTHVPISDLVIDTSESGDAALTSRGVLFGHLYMGASLIKGFTAGHDYNKEKVQMLIHMILSHHGTQEWGAVACPAIPEALALHYIDNLDAKMYMFEEQYENLAEGEISEKKVFGLDNRVYKPKY